MDQGAGVEHNPSLLRHTIAIAGVDEGVKVDETPISALSSTLAPK